MFPLRRDGRTNRRLDVVLAHQGGWDEMLMVLIPIAVVVLLLRVASRRAKAAAGQTPPKDE
jgi:hypothetical protein